MSAEQAGSESDEEYLTPDEERGAEDEEEDATRRTGTVGSKPSLPPDLGEEEGKREDRVGGEGKGENDVRVGGEKGILLKSLPPSDRVRPETDGGGKEDGEEAKRDHERLSAAEKPPCGVERQLAPLPLQPGLAAEEEAPPPVAPPRLKRRKKRLQKPASLENMDMLSGDAPFLQRSMTVGSVGYSRESSTTPTETRPLLSTEELRAPLTRALVREGSGELQTASLDRKISRRQRVIADNVSSRGHSRQGSGADPAVLIADANLELTEEMICGSENETVTTATDPAGNRARGSGSTGEGVIIRDESEGEGEEGEEEEAEGKGKSGGGRADRTTPVPEAPTDDTILNSIMVKNLDTGEVIPLSAAEEKIPRGWDYAPPLSEHLMRRTNQLEGRTNQLEGDEEDGDDSHGRATHIRKKLKFWQRGKGKQGRQGPLVEGAIGSASDDESAGPYPQDRLYDSFVKYKPSSHLRRAAEFDKTRLKQDISGQHLGAVWVMEFSICGRLLATAGQDSVVRVWVLRTAYTFFHELQAKYQRVGVHSSGDSLAERISVTSSSSRSSDPDEDGVVKTPFLGQPLCTYCGHTADVLDLSWSKNFFLLSSSMDKTVRLWHISRKECLCCFQHVDFVTAITFHPRDDRYFLSGSLDGKLRLWNIPDKKVALWNEIEGTGSRLITAACFCMNGKLAVAGTYDGRCIFYETEHLKYHTQIQVRSRHGKNKGRKISGVEPLPGEDKLLVTSNDSRIRLYDLRDHSLSCKYKGGVNSSSQIKATFSRDGQYIISGSEDNFVYVWQTHHDVSKLSSTRRDRNEFYESFSCHSAPVTAAVFAPVPGITVDEGLKEVGHMVVAADYQGCIKIYVNTEHL